MSEWKELTALDSPCHTHAECAILKNTLVNEALHEQEQSRLGKFLGFYVQGAIDYRQKRPAMCKASSGFFEGHFSG